MKTTEIPFDRIILRGNEINNSELNSEKTRSKGEAVNMKRQEKLVVFLSLLIVFLDYKAFMAAPVNNFVFVQCVRRQIVLYFLECLPVFHF